MRNDIFFITLAAATLWAGQIQAGELYADPADGWSYIYHGEEADAGADGSGFTSLDGTWSHDNGSDQWNSDYITDGIGAPGGILPITDDYTYLRLEDTGDPRDSFPDPGSNRKLFFIHDIGEDGATDDVMDTGITLTFRARIPSDGPLDGGTAGNGYVLHDQGKSSFTISQNGVDGPATISFALAAEEEDQTDFTGGGLAMNSSSGPETGALVDWQGTEGTKNLYPVDDPTQWNEFWINIFKNPDDVGSHTVVVYANGDTEDQEVYSVTAGTGRDYDGNYIAMGLGSTPQVGALDVDFFGWAPGLIAPTLIEGGNGDGCDFDGSGACDFTDLNELLYSGIASGEAKYDLDGSGTVDLADRDAFLSEIGRPLGDFSDDGRVTAADLNVVGGNWQKDGITSYADGDANGDGMINATDLNAVGSNWQAGVAQAATAAVPEPSAALLMLLAISGFTLMRRP